MVHVERVKKWVTADFGNADWMNEGAAFGTGQAVVHGVAKVFARYKVDRCCRELWREQGLVL